MEVVEKGSTVLVTGEVNNVTSNAQNIHVAKLISVQ